MSEKIDDCVEKLLSDLRHFQERQYLKDPIKVTIIIVVQEHQHFLPHIALRIVNYRVRQRDGMCVD